MVIICKAKTHRESCPFLSSNVSYSILLNLSHGKYCDRNRKQSVILADYRYFSMFINHQTSRQSFYQIWNTGVTCLLNNTTDTVPEGQVIRELFEPYFI